MSQPGVRRTRGSSGIGGDETGEGDAAGGTTVTPAHNDDVQVNDPAQVEMPTDVNPTATAAETHGDQELQ